jgi:hypothetical protein
MITINRSLVLASALAVTALVVAFETGSPRAANPPTPGEVAQRFPLPGEMFTPVALTTYLAPKVIAAQKAAAARAPRRACFSSSGRSPLYASSAKPPITSAATNSLTSQRSANPSM